MQSYIVEIITALSMLWIGQMSLILFIIVLDRYYAV